MHIQFFQLWQLSHWSNWYKQDEWFDSWKRCQKYISSHIPKGSLAHSASCLPIWYNSHFIGGKAVGMKLTTQVQIWRTWYLGKGVTLILPLPFVFLLIYAVTEKSVLEALNLKRDTIYAFANLFQMPHNIINRITKGHIGKGKLSCSQLYSWLRSMYKTSFRVSADLIQGKLMRSTCIFTAGPNLISVQQLNSLILKVLAE
jgi:hypothetical protein